MMNTTRSALKLMHISLLYYNLQHFRTEFCLVTPRVQKRKLLSFHFFSISTTPALNNYIFRMPPAISSEMKFLKNAKCPHPPKDNSIKAKKEL